MWNLNLKTSENCTFLYKLKFGFCILIAVSSLDSTGLKKAVILFDLAEWSKANPIIVIEKVYAPSLPLDQCNIIKIKTDFDDTGVTNADPFCTASFAKEPSYQLCS